ncbi:MAG: riboflavin synthase [Oceanicaulis sp.]|nr:riboflavin synthase [Oceanicaulis sp.]
MFTGIVTALGRVAAIKDGPVRRISIDSPYAPESFELGCSVSHDGACLTVVAAAPQGVGARHDVEVSPETLARTTLGAWTVGTQVNLERALKVGDELGGHIVQGHVDGVGQVQSREDADGWMRLRIAAPRALAPFIAEKGSIAVDGVSLTVNGVEETAFDLMIIPHTASVTTLARLQPGAHVNLEVDVMARYAARLIDFRPAGTPP